MNLQNLEKYKKYLLILSELFIFLLLYCEREKFKEIIQNLNIICGFFFVIPTSHTYFYTLHTGTKMIKIIRGRYKLPDRNINKQ